MGYALYTGQMIEALCAADNPEGPRLLAKFHELTKEAATILADEIEADVTPDRFSDFFDGQYAAVFAPLHEGQALPDAIAGYDNAEEWSES